MKEIKKLGFCGVDCSACPDYLDGKCPDCRRTIWEEGCACTPVEFAEMVIKKSGRSCRIVPVRDIDLPSHARRPLNSRLTAELPAGIAPMPSVEDALDRYLEEIIH